MLHLFGTAQAEFAADVHTLPSDPICKGADRCVRCSLYGRPPMPRRHVKRKLVGSPCAVCDGPLIYSRRRRRGEVIPICPECAKAAVDATEAAVRLKAEALM